MVLKYKDNISAELIHNIEVEFGLSIVQKNSIYNLYTCKQDALSVSNKIYEKGIVEFCTPNFITKTQNYSYPNDTYFDKQWYLHNTGQGTNDNKTTTPDADIDALEAWQITKGSPNVIVAVIDEGITNNHPDLPLTRQVRLPGSNFAYQYDGSNNPNDPSPTLSYYSGNNHGNACAGIIAATQGNNEGITGIAPLCKIMPTMFYQGIPHRSASIPQRPYQNCFAIDPANKMRISFFYFPTLLPHSFFLGHW